jgi:hypothetical protein
LVTPGALFNGDVQAASATRTDACIGPRRAPKKMGAGADRSQPAAACCRHLAALPHRGSMTRGFASLPDPPALQTGGRLWPDHGNGVRQVRRGSRVSMRMAAPRSACRRRWTSEAVLINTSGGVTGGDRLEWAAEAEGGASSRSQPRPARRSIAPGTARPKSARRSPSRTGARIDWLPQETSCSTVARSTGGWKPTSRRARSCWPLRRRVWAAPRWTRPSGRRALPTAGASAARAVWSSPTTCGWRVRWATARAVLGGAGASPRSC